jgi:hypothetical protein
LLAFVTMLIALAWGAVLAGSPDPSVAAFGSGSAGIDAFETAGDDRDAPPSEAPADVNDDDDDDNDDQEAFTHEAYIVATRAPIVRCTTPDVETIRPSLGHPRGIDDPPRS